jgi:SH2 domain
VLLNQEGAFVIRESTSGRQQQPYTMCLFHDGTVFTLMIRRKPNGKLALGSEKPLEEVGALVNWIELN